MDENSIQQAFEAFMADEKAVEEAIDSSTTASDNGSGYSVELFNDGTFRVLWDNNIGNLYKSAGIIISIPALSEDERDVLDDDGEVIEGTAFYDNAIDQLRRDFEYVMSERTEN